MKPLRFALAALLFPACDSADPDPISMAGRWNVEATAPDRPDDFCALSGTLTLSGTLGAFSGAGDLSVVRVTGGRAQASELPAATLAGNGREVVLAGIYRLTVESADRRRMAGTWDCGQGAGGWVLFRTH